MAHGFDVDPNNLHGDFGRHWETYTNGKVSQFLPVFIEMKMAKAHAALETVTHSDELFRLQGEVRALKSLLTTMSKTSVPMDELKQVTEHLKKK